MVEGSLWNQQTCQLLKLLDFHQGLCTQPKSSYVPLWHLHCFTIVVLPHCPLLHHILSMHHMSFLCSKKIKISFFCSVQIFTSLLSFSYSLNITPLVIIIFFIFAGCPWDLFWLFLGPNYLCYVLQSLHKWYSVTLFH